MKFLKYRKDFVNENSNLSKEIESSALVKEYLENDIRFGDSYFGRLVNSSMQMIKTAFKTIRIPFLLQSLENQMQIMVDRAKFDQITKEYPTLFLKAKLEEIKSCCTSTLSNEEKLEILIGWDGTFDPYNPSKPTDDISGYYENRKIVIPCMVQDNYNEISKPETRSRLEKAFNKQIIKTYLDTISNFSDDLRKFAYEISHPGALTAPSTSGPKPFNTNLLDVLKNIVQLNLTEKFSRFKFLSYDNFLNEDNLNKDTHNLEQLQKLATTLIPKIEKETEEQIKNSQEFKQFIQILGNLGMEEMNILKNNDLVNSLQSLTNQKIEVEKTTKEPTTEPSVDPNQVEQTPKEDKSIQTPQVTAKPDEMSKEVDMEEENPTTQTETEESTEVKNESGSLKYSSYIRLILEETAGLPAAPVTTTGTTTPAATTATAAPKNVQTIWEKFFDEVDKVLPAQMTQDDIDKLKSYTPESVDLAYSITSKPDPLIKIIKIFETANSIYTTPTIPSGRENGEVWPLTFRRYTFVGTGSPGTAKSPGYGPWVHNPLFKQWKSGVLGIMSKPEYKEIFKNIKPLVEQYNKNSDKFEKINEQDSTTTQSTSQNITEFFVDILKIKNQGDFDNYVANALNKFFGIKIDPNKLRGSRSANSQQIPTDEKDIDANTFVWEPFKQGRFEKSNENQYFAFPIEDLRADASKKTHQVIFLRVLSVNGNKVEVKFTYDNQGEVDVIMENLGLKDAKKVNWSCDKKSYKATRYVYYGVMKNDFSNGIQMCYTNVAGSIGASYAADNIYGEPSSKGGVIFKFSNSKVSLDSGDTTNLYPAKLIYFDSGKKKQEVKKDANISLNREQTPDKLKSLPVQGSSTKLYDELLKKGTERYNW